jgi:RimJ/RimL family protein N-acetyltransferase
MNIHFRKLNPADVQLYRQIRLEALKNYPEHFGSSYEEESASPKLGFEVNIEMQADNKFVTGAFDDDKLIGICGFAQETRLKVKHRGLIIQMYIQPQYQGQKLGLQLLQATVNQAFQLPDVEQIVLGVITSNLAAAKIYAQAGFKEFGTHPAYLKIGNKYFDERLMVLHKQT